MPTGRRDDVERPTTRVVRVPTTRHRAERGRAARPQRRWRRVETQGGGSAATATHRRPPHGTPPPGRAPVRACPSRAPVRPHPPRGSPRDGRPSPPPPPPPPCHRAACLRARRETARPPTCRVCLPLAAPRSAGGAARMPTRLFSPTRRRLTGASAAPWRDTSPSTPPAAGRTRSPAVAGAGAVADAGAHVRVGEEPTSLGEEAPAINMGDALRKGERGPWPATRRKRTLGGEGPTADDPAKRARRSPVPSRPTQTAP